MSFRAAREELERQARVQDRKFLDGSLFLFELIVPTAAIKSSNSPGTEVRLFYPLVVSPNSIYFDEPFTVAISPGTNGGLVVEENGIIQRKIRLEGTTGFAPKPLETSGPIGADYNVVASYSKRGKFIAGETFSGQKHFQFLQDKVFRTYADLKRDPTYARDTKLIFHNLKDEESWLVVPETFTLNRQSSDGPLYRYQIQLNAVAPATYRAVKADKKVKERRWWDSVKDATKTIRNLVNKIRGALEYVQQFFNDISRVVADIIEVANAVLSFVNLITETINNVRNFVTGLFRQASDLANRVRAVGVALSTSVLGLPIAVSQAFQKMADDFEGIAVSIKSSIQNSLQASATSSTTGRRNALAAESVARSASPATAISNVGTTLTVADVANILNSANLGATPPRINSLENYVISSADNLPSISLRFLGSAKFWSIIAEINNLRPPYISQIPLPSTVRPGEAIVVPSTAAAIAAEGESGFIGLPEDSWEARQLFRDVKLVKSSRHRNKFDLSVDTAKSGKDVEYVAGIENLTQAVLTRLGTVLGENVLYPDLGFPDVIGLKQPIVDAEILRILTAQTLTADNRIQDIGSIRVENTESLDFFKIEVSALVRGFADPVQVNAARQF